MKYNFDKIIDRSKNNSAKFDELELKFGRDDLIPMWIADMDFKTADSIVNAMIERAEEGIYGYTSRPDSYYESVKKWQEYKNNWSPETKYMSHALGVLPMLVNVCLSILKKGDKVIIQTPVFSEFKVVLDDWDMEVLYNPLKKNGLEYEIDFEDLEMKAKEADYILFCSPHNPIGRVWKKEEIERVCRICIDNNVTIISDEIYSDIMLFGNKHVPTASISEEFRKNTITFTSATKTFNLAGLQMATIIFPNEFMKDEYEKIIAKLQLKRNNAFSVVANEVAFETGKDWLNQVIEYIENNVAFAVDFINKNIPRIKCATPESTYLLWLDCSSLGLTQEELVKFFVNEAKLALNNGDTFGVDGTGYMRMNIACPRSVLEKALNQLKDAVDRF